MDLLKVRYFLAEAHVDAPNPLAPLWQTFPYKSHASQANWQTCALSLTSVL